MSCAVGGAASYIVWVEAFAGGYVKRKNSSRWLIECAVMEAGLMGSMEFIGLLGKRRKAAMSRSCCGEVTATP